MMLTITKSGPLHVIYRCVNWTGRQWVCVLVACSPLDGDRDSTNVDLILWSLLMPTTLSPILVPSTHPTPNSWLRWACRQRITLCSYRDIQPLHFSTPLLQRKPHHKGVWPYYVTGNCRLKQVIFKQSATVFGHNVFAAPLFVQTLKQSFKNPDNRNRYPYWA